MVTIDESEWQRIKANRRALTGELRAMRHLANCLMASLAWAHASNAPQENFWDYAGISEEQYRWWEDNK